MEVVRRPHSRQLPPRSQFRLLDCPTWQARVKGAVHLLQTVGAERKDGLVTDGLHRHRRTAEHLLESGHVPQPERGRAEHQEHRVSGAIPKTSMSFG